MELVADFLLVAGALSAGFFCFILSRRLNRFNDLEKGVGGAVALLSAQVDDLARTLVSARETSNGSNAALDELTGRAEAVAQRLELMIASMHDIPGAGQTNVNPKPPRATTHNPAGPMFVRHERSENGASQ